MISWSYIWRLVKINIIDLLMKVVGNYTKNRYSSVSGYSIRLLPGGVDLMPSFLWKLFTECRLFIFSGSYIMHLKITVINRLI